MTNDRVIDQLKALSEKYGMMYGDLDVIDHAIEALHRCDVAHSSAEPRAKHPILPCGCSLVNGALYVCPTHADGKPYLPENREVPHE